MLKVQVSNQHFKSFYQENSLLIQLILKELKGIFDLKPSLEALEKFDSLDQYAWLNYIHSYLNHLVGEQDEGTFSHCEKGPLARLKSYCQHFQSIDEVEDKSLINFCVQVNQIYLQAKQLWHLVHSFEILQNQRKKESFLTKIQKNIQSTSNFIDNILKAFLNCLKKFNNDENVVFFLLRKKAVLIKLYGLKITNQLFENFSKKGCLATLLITRFKSRGFDHLLPIIKRELFFYESNQLSNM